MTLCMVTPAVLAGDLRDTQILEIQHLIKYVADSGCTFIRNGNVYSSAAAVAHINKKYAYFKADIDSAEKFIELSATQSTLTGRQYTIKCPGKEAVESRQWLWEELQALRRRDNKP